MPAITFGGIGSGMDVEGIITGLTNASRGPITLLNTRVNDTTSAISSLSDIGNFMSSLKGVVEALDTTEEVSSYSGKSSNESISITTSGSALPGAYNIEVTSLASEQRTYSNTLGGSSTTALGQAGTLDFNIDGTNASVAIDAGDNLNDVVTKINASGLRMTASTFFDGTDYRLQVRGLDTGAANAIAMTETGTTFGLTTPANTRQQASDAVIKLDDYQIKSATNQFSGAIPGVTLNVSKLTTEPARIEIATDGTKLKEKITSVVNAYNNVINNIHRISGFGSLKASNSALAGDSALRTITNKLSEQMSKSFGSGDFQTMRSVGIQLNNDGTLKLDSSALDKALAKNPADVGKFFAGSDSGDGAMDSIRDLVKSLTDPTNGTLTNRKEGLEARKTALQKTMDQEEARLTRYSELLRKQFSAMDTSVSNSQAQLAYLQRI